MIDLATFDTTLGLFIIACICFLAGVSFERLRQMRQRMLRQLGPIYTQGCSFCGSASHTRSQCPWEKQLSRGQTS